MALQISYDRHISVTIDVLGAEGETFHDIGIHRRSETNTYDYESGVSEGTIYNHEGTDLELLEKVLHGRYLSSKAAALLRN